MSGSLAQNLSLERQSSYLESQIKQLTNTQNLIPTNKTGSQDHKYPMNDNDVKVKKSESVVTLYTSKNVQSPQKLVEQLAKEKGFMNSPIIIVENISKVTSASSMTSLTPPTVQSPPNLYVSMPTPDSSVQTSQSSSSQEVHRCEECDYSSHNKHYLKQHVDLVHCANRPYKCPFCNYAGKRSHSLREHLLVHSNERPFVCIHCHATFRKKGHLTNHSKLHQNMVTCPMCKMSIPQPDVEAHMKSVHQIDRLYVCDVCNFMAVNKSEIEDHLKMHETPFSKVYVCEMCNHKSKSFEEFCVHAESHRGSISVQKGAEKGSQVKHDKTPQASTERKMMKCSECGFVSGDITQMKDHMLIHINEEKNGEKTRDETPKTSTEPTKVASNQPPVSTVPGVKAAYKCVECEFSCSEAYVFVVHMLTHRPDLQISSDKLLSESSEQQKSGQINPQIMNEMVMQKNQNRATSVQQAPITMALQRMPKTTKTTVISPPSKTQAFDSSATNASMASQVTTSVISTNLQPMVSKYLSPILSHQGTVSSTVDTDQDGVSFEANPKNQNSENLPFVYNSASSKFKCTVCGYTCDYQRTIKAHIWKHSGNKNIDYPMFQNGPLSIYEGSPAAESEKPPVNHNASITVPEMPKNQQAGSAQTIVIEKFQQQINKTTSVSPVAPVLANMLAMRAKQKDPNGEFESMSQDQMPVTSCEKPSGPPPLLQVAPFTHDTINAVSAFVDPVQSNNGVDVTTQGNSDKAVLIFSDGSGSATNQQKPNKGITSPSSEDQQESTDKDETPEDVILVSENRDKTDTVLEEPRRIEPLNLKRKVGMVDVSKKSSKKICIEETQNVVVETVDNSNVTSFTGMKSQQNSPRAISEISQSELSDSGVGSDSNTVVAASVEKSSSLESRSEDLSKESTIFQDFGNEVIVSSTSCDNDDGMDIDNEEDTESNASEDDMSEEEEISIPKRKRMPSTSMTESAVTLLSLLKKGPNQNPACPVTTTSTSDMIDGEEKPKQGISSSLLAVIEQLRERSKTEAELEELTGITVTKKSGRRRMKRELLEDLSEIENMGNVERIEEDGEVRLRCKLCHYSSVNTVIIKQHMRLHKTKQPFECSLCDFIATSSESLQDHMIQHCKVRTYQCKLCASAFNYKSQLRAHMRAHTEKEVYVCDDCDFETTNPVSYRNHVRGHNEKKQYKCEVCDRKFISKCELKSHKKLICSNQKSFQCEECDFIAIGPQEQRQHAKIHNKEFKCAKCEYNTTSITRFENHAKIHDEPKTLKCELCDFPAVSNRSLKSHMKRHINDQRFVQQPLEQYKCNICGYVCHHLPSLKSHMWRHASDQNYSYEFTNEVINAAIDYDSRLDSYECQKDDIRVFFATIRQKLKDRLEGMNAPGDAQSAACWVTFRCCQCGFETINKAELNVHMKSHSDIIKWTLQVNDKQKKEKV